MRENELQERLIFFVELVEEESETRSSNHLDTSLDLDLDLASFF